MRFAAEAYRQAALEHVATARELYDANPPHYVLAHYISGLAVECMLRAYLCRISPEFDERHDLRALYKAAQFDEIVPPDLQEKIGTARSIVESQWQNNHRFCSEEYLRSFFKRLMLDRGIRGDFLKERTRQIVNAAFELVNVGNKQWTKSPKN